MGIFDDNPNLKWLVVGAVGSAFIAMSYDVFQGLFLPDFNGWSEPYKTISAKFVAFSISLSIGVLFFLLIKSKKSNQNSNNSIEMIKGGSHVNRYSSSNYPYVIIALFVIVLVNVYYINNFLFPPAEPAIVKSENLRNFTVISTGTDYDNNHTGIMRETDRFVLQITVENKYPDNTRLYYSDTITQSNPSPYIPVPSPIIISKGGYQTIPRTFYLHGGVNAIDATFDFYTDPNQTSGKMWPSPVEIGKATVFNLATVRAITESEYEGRFVLIATVVLAEATIALVIVSQLNVKETREIIRETLESNRLFSLELQGKFKLSFDFKDPHFYNEAGIWKFGCHMWNIGNVSVRNISIYHIEYSSLIVLNELIKNEENIKTVLLEKVDSIIEPGRDHYISFTIPQNIAENTTADCRIVIWLEYDYLHGKEEGIAFIDRYSNGQTGYAWFDNDSIQNKRKELKP